MFHQREIVRIGEPEAVAAWRDALARPRGRRCCAASGSTPTSTSPPTRSSAAAAGCWPPASAQQALKFEILVQIAGPEPTAVASFNYHQDHFAEAFGIELADGGVAHTACLGFGLERITLALLRAHGLDPATWPDEVREELWPR